MENSNKEKRKSRKFNIFVLLFAIVVIYSIFSGFRMVSLRNEKLRQISENERVISNLNSSIDELRDEIDKSKTDEFIEKVAREDLGMVRPREIIYVIKDQEVPEKKN
ncbi:septum formation initiator family protein [Peptoniphilus sp. GNH]|nr:putative cell division protein FtsL [Clostridiales bacterium KA00134]UHR02720.1 septum formation initiator family protein [Peptoniphilus sp. GNH]